MDNNRMNFTSPEASANITAPITGRVTVMEIGIFGINILFGVPIHSYVIWLIVTGTGNGISSNIFIFNLSVCEMINCLDCLAFMMSKWFPHCMIFGLFLQGIIIAGRPLFQCLICVERYLAVVHPVTFLKFKPLRYRVLCSVFAWTGCMVSCLFCFFAFISSKIAEHAVFFSSFFLILLFIQVFCLSAVLRVLKQSGPGERGREINHMKRRAFHLILITTVSMIIIYVPATVSGFLTFKTNEYISEFWFPALLSYLLGGFLQPVLYLQRSSKLSCCAPG